MMKGEQGTWAVAGVPMMRCNIVASFSLVDDVVVLLVLVLFAAIVDHVLVVNTDRPSGAGSRRCRDLSVTAGIHPPACRDLTPLSRETAAGISLSRVYSICQAQLGFNPLVPRNRCRDLLIPRMLNFS
jgi:hypothetical protein